ncbi:thiol-disulfide isomerase [Pigmentiphaga aceris]|uniref:Thiol-disulfide isomerase n=2 Tax=Pigmentiphaga aceris TaxID=1940612 RepID=A0A5C0B3H6_9BURK|nr:thiol-disulfide isomerase [Pigmentiphaga aceris]
MSVAAIALWQYFGMGGQRAFSEKAVVFGDADLRLPAALAGATGRIRLVHFWDPECSTCNRETSAHLSYLISMYRRANIDFYSVRKPGTTGELPAFLQGKLQALDAIDGMASIPASPFVAIWDAEGRLAFAGPYSLGVVCTSANSFVEPIIDKLVAGETTEPFGLLAIGCYCPWAKT